MRLTFLGTGSAFTLANYQTNALIQFDDGQRLLIDCGGDARHGLNNLGLNYKDIDAVYISHLHGDHIHGLEWLGFCRKFDPSTARPKLFISETLVTPLWSNSLSGGMGSVQGSPATLDTYFDVHPVGKNDSFYFGGHYFDLVQVVHIFDGYTIQPSFGLMFGGAKGIPRVFYTSDTQSNPNQMMDWYKEAEVVFHDCETTPFLSGVHSNYKELMELPEEIRNKMFLTHYQDGAIETYKSAREDGFQGFVLSLGSFDLKTLKLTATSYD
jgi:ribonuclease BN (tRNA processing enzyme)